MHSSNTKNTDFQNRFLQSLTKYASKPLGFDKMYTDEETFKKGELEYASSLPLQIIIYFNTFFSIVWVIGTCFLWPTLIFITSEATRVWIILILFSFILMVIFEIIRIYLAYVGNLSERVPELTGFWLLTLMVQAPLSTFVLAITWVPIDGQIVLSQFLPMQFALHVFHTLFVYSEIILGFFALRVLARYQISRFHYKQFDQANVYTDDVVKENDLDWLSDLEKKNSYYKMKSF